MTSDGWYKMGDYGFYDEKERVHVLERVNDLILLPSGKLVIKIILFEAIDIYEITENV